MFNTLYGKLAAVLFGLFCVIGAVAVALTLYSTRLYFQEVSQKLNRTLAERMVSEQVLMLEGRVNEEALKEVFHQLMVINPSIELYLLDPQGTILTFSAPPGKVKRQRISLEPLERFLSGAEDFPILGDDPRDITRRKVFSVFPIETLDGSLEGYLYIILGGEEFDSVMQMLEQSYILRLSLWTVGAILVGTLLAGLLCLKLLTRRLSSLASVMETFRCGELVTQPDVSSPADAEPSATRRGDDIDQLAMTFSHMTSLIRQQVHQLKETDQLRRELVANVSHDLRTPVTSLQGYLETLVLKEGMFSQQERQRYLGIAIAQSKRLGELIEELFELAKLNSQEMKPRIESFSLSELVQDVVQKFRLTVEAKQMTLQAKLGEDLPFVSADIGLIERVLENLIENALRYTLQGGRITVILNRMGENVMTRVTDTGCGIPPEDLPHVFDRYYQVGKNHRSNDKGAGLGLAITKRILELHGSAIEVQSVVNQGTTFVFHLAVAQPSVLPVATVTTEYSSHM
ncbi:ATP-binding protein [Candidatus Nitrospira nitrificans]|uniref:histidine kinase n=1 Tax=Candidatus Nitrospira nitrificans TaxID=1742973 RepID=A0A0S4LNM2_9BACT|nr:ATP-binding protein [Candidatus Nitrospira nitrificans]CUS38847.1 Two-component system sensor histidine kinase [Candidatus Nitrospira nitrificans]